jgi:hypothetical protein
MIFNSDGSVKTVDPTNGWGGISDGATLNGATLNIMLLLMKVP